MSRIFFAHTRACGTADRDGSRGRYEFATSIKVSWVIVVFDTDGEVIFATASRLTHKVFNSLPNINPAYFRLRQQYYL
jgi:hypothetical protein